LAGRNRLSGAEVGLVGMAFAIMGLLPIISHDYKLVIQAVPLLLLMTRSSETLFASPGEAYAMAALASVATALMFIPSYVPLPLAWLGSDYGELLRVKTPWLLTAFIAYAHLAFRGVAAAATAILPTEERPV